MKSRTKRVLAVAAITAVGLFGLPATTSQSSESLIGSPEGDRIHIISYNVRVDVDPSPYTWEERHPRVVSEVLEAEQPTILAVQEAEYDMARDIAKALPGSYEWLGVGPWGSSTKGLRPIIFDVDRLEPLGFAHRWLSNTPMKMGSTSWDESVPRQVTWVTFRDRNTDKEFTVLNTHLDHKSAEGRREAATLINSRVNGWRRPTIALGDFNAAERESTVWDNLLADGVLVGTWEEADERLTPAYKTATGYSEEIKVGKRVDWITTTPEFHALETAIKPPADPEYPPSDHLPVQALVELS